MEQALKSHGKEVIAVSEKEKEQPKPEPEEKKPEKPFVDLDAIEEKDEALDDYNK